MELSANQAKGIIAMMAGLASYLMGRVTELVIILVVMMIIDYVTGVSAAYVQGKLQSRKSILGVIKKICYMVLLGLAFFLDYTITYLVETAGVQSPINGLFGIATTLWLIGTEGLSILKNLNRIGVPFPPFLKNAFGKLQGEAEKISGNNVGGGN